MSSWDVQCVWKNSPWYNGPALNNIRSYRLPTTASQLCDLMVLYHANVILITGPLWRRRWCVLHMLQQHNYAEKQSVRHLDYFPRVRRTVCSFSCLLWFGSTSITQVPQRMISCPAWCKPIFKRQICRSRTFTWVCVTFTLSRITYVSTSLPIWYTSWYMEWSLITNQCLMLVDRMCNVVVTSRIDDRLMISKFIMIVLDTKITDVMIGYK